MDVVDLHHADAAGEAPVGGQLPRQTGGVARPAHEHGLPEGYPREKTLEHKQKAFDFVSLATQDY